MRSRYLAVIALAAILPSHGFAAGNDAMEKAADGFYKVYATFHPSDGIPDAAARARYAPYISPALNKLFADARAAEEKFLARNKDTPPIIEGDLMTSNFEGATSFKIGTCAGDARTARCPVDLIYADADPKNKPVRWTDTAILANTPEGWRVDDIAYGANWDFANKGRMSETLRVAIKTASD
ncbi:MAG: hypothetical protein ACTHLR_00315 [Rhizomicrobium sp.]